MHTDQNSSGREYKTETKAIHFIDDYCPAFAEANTATEQKPEIPLNGETKPRYQSLVGAFCHINYLFQIYHYNEGSFVQSQ